MDEKKAIESLRLIPSATGVSKIRKTVVLMQGATARGVDAGIWQKPGWGIKKQRFANKQCDI